MLIQFNFISCTIRLQECIVVCVVSLEEINVQPDNVPYSQCREVRTVNSPTNNMDKITIAASAAICGTVVIAVIIFVATSRRRSRKLHTLDGGHPGKMGLPVGGKTSAVPSIHIRSQHTLAKGDLETGYCG